MRLKKYFLLSLPFFICALFFIAYTILVLVKHFHFLSGYDLAIADQIVWKYSQFKAPITTVQSFAFTSLLTDHVEIIYILLAPFYWIYNSVITLVVLQVIAIICSGYAIFLLAKTKGLSLFASCTVLISYLLFYGIQNALWSDVHSLVFGVSFLAWFIYFFESKKWKLTLLFFLLALSCKEDIALLTFVISMVFLLKQKSKQSLLFMALSWVYLFGIFFVYFPHFTHDGYRYQNPHGMLSDTSPKYFIDTFEKKQVILYSLGWFGFLPVLAPIYLLVATIDLAHYFVLGHAIVTSAQGFFLHYRSSLALFLVWPTIIVLSKFKKYSFYLSIYLLICAFVIQYLLHLPLSYLTKSWFWHNPSSTKNIELVLMALPQNASVVSQNNITPHITHRDVILTLWPNTKDFKTDSPCGQINCNWFRWSGHADYLVVDTSRDWDIRHFLATKEIFNDGISNLEKTHVVAPIKRVGNATLYKIIGKDIIFR